MVAWQNRIQVKKGNFAEEVVHKFLEDKGYIVYIPKTDGAHAFDKLAIKNKEKIVIVEVKAKAKLNHYDETGIEYRHFLEYKKISEKHAIPIYIFFVDEMLGEIYGNFMSKLIKNSRMAPWGKQILFRISDMERNIHKLSKEEILFLKNNSTRKHQYINK